MSLAKVYTIQKAQKDQGKCQRCGVELKKGEPYRWFKVGFRARAKNLRCTKASCAPLESERESGKVAAVYAAQEAFRSNIDGLADLDDIEAEVHTVGESIREMAEEYQEAADAWENGNESLQEKADHWSSVADELESWSSSGEEEPELDEEADADEVAEQEEAHDAWLDALREEATDAVDSIDFI